MPGWLRLFEGHGTVRFVTMGTMQMTDDKFSRLKRMLEVDPGNARLRRDCIDAAIGARQFDFVLDAANKVLEGSPHDSEALFDRATALIGTRDYRAAIETLAPFAALMPEVEGVNFNLGLSHYCLNDFAAARPYLDRSYANGNRSSGLLRLLISTYHHLGLIDEAVVVAGENSAAAHEDPALAGVLALLYLDAGQALGAARWSRVALRANPDSTDGLIVDATLRAAQMDVHRAEAGYRRVLELAPENGRAWVGLGSLAVLAQDFTAARADLERGLKSMPDHVGSWHVLGWTYLLTGDYPQAQRVFEHALELDRNFAETHGALAAVAALTGDRAAAQREIELAERLDPAGLAAKFARSVLVGQGGDPQAARDIIRRALVSLSPKDGGAVSRIIDELTGGP
jgi:Flp pilus assembly protein TadD